MVNIFVGQQITLWSAQGLRRMGVRFVHWNLRRYSLVGRPVAILRAAPELGKEPFGVHTFPFLATGRAFGLRLRASGRIGLSTAAPAGPVLLHTASSPHGTTRYRNTLRYAVRWHNDRQGSCRALFLIACLRRSPYNFRGYNRGRVFGRNACWFDNFRRDRWLGNISLCRHAGLNIAQRHLSSNS